MPATPLKKETDIVFLIDSSRGVSENVFNKEKRFVTALADNFNVKARGPRASAVTYGSTVNTIFTFTEPNFKTRVNNATMVSTQRRVDIALERSAQILRTSVANRKIVILLTTGRQSENKPVSNAVKQLRSLDAEVYVVAIGRNPDNEALARIVLRSEVSFCKR